MNSKAEIARDAKMQAYSLRQYLTMQAMLAGASWPLAIEAVSSVAIEHPEWNLDERRIWSDWEKENL